MKAARNYARTLPVVMAAISRPIGAPGVAAQFELTLRQVDVIGTWKRARSGRGAGISCDRRAWPHLAARAAVRRFCGWPPRSGDIEDEHRAVYDVTAYPLFQQALAAVPATERIGALVTDERGRPVTRRYYLGLYRDVADAAGVPRVVWNMHARHGGATEAEEAGVSLEDIAEHAQHTDINTTRKYYILPSVERSRRVARQRVAHRRAKKNTP
jgi:integrase